MDILWMALGLRVLNFLLWMMAAQKLRMQEQPVALFTRRMIVSVNVIGSFAFMIGGLTPFGFSGEAARWIYTVTAAYSAIVAASIATSREVV